MQDSKSGPSLKDFPPVLQKVATLIIVNEQSLSIRQATELIGANYSGVLKAIYRCRKKGKDFGELISKLGKEVLKENVARVDKAIVNTAVAGSAKHAELFYRRLGLWQERVEHRHNHQHLHFSAPLPL